MQKLGFGVLLNRKICSIELAKKTFSLPKYGLSSLKEHFDISFGEPIELWVMLEVVLIYLINP